MMTEPIRVVLADFTVTKQNITILLKGYVTSTQILRQIFARTVFMRDQKKNSMHANSLFMYMCAAGLGLGILFIIVKTLQQQELEATDGV